MIHWLCQTLLLIYKINIYGRALFLNPLAGTNTKNNSADLTPDSIS